VQTRLQNHLQRQKVSLRVLYNGSEVCHTMPYTLDSQTFSMEMSILLPLSTLQWPQNFSVQVVEQTSIKKTPIAEVSKIKIQNNFCFVQPRC
jgi:CC2D2A N-terminal C2 domain